MNVPRSKPQHLRRFERTNDARFLTFSCNHRLPLFGHPRIRDCFARHLTQSKDVHGFHLYAWVVMPEHVHLLLWPLLPDAPVTKILHGLKRHVAEEVVARWRELDAPILHDLKTPDGAVRFWQRGGGYDRNIFTPEEFAEKVRYIHNNPVTRGLVAAPEDWAWSSARWYARREGIAMDPLPPQRPTR